MTACSTLKSPPEAVLILAQHQHPARAERQRSGDGNGDGLGDFEARLRDQRLARGFAVEIELRLRPVPGERHEVPAAIRDQVAVDVQVLEGAGLQRHDQPIALDDHGELVGGALDGVGDDDVVAALAGPDPEGRG
jgi:hypothetical protein